MILDGKALSITRQDALKKRVETFSEPPHLVVILTTENPASHTYVKAKEKAAQKVGIKSTIIHDTTLDEAALLKTIKRLNDDSGVHGILVQLPLKAGMNVDQVMEAIDPKKDVDGFHPLNVAALFQHRKGLVPATPRGIMMLLDAYDIEVARKHVVIIGRSQIVGTPLIHLFLQKNATVTVCHSKTEDLKSHTLSADILVVAIGRAKFLTADYVRPEATVIDVGINRVDGKLLGDVDFTEIEPIAKAITPVPKGVGPMTITALLENTLDAYEAQRSAE